MATQHLSQRCCNIGYDILTIIISIADVSTDVIVLIDFYQKDRMIFFGISLAILILANCSYAIAFTLRFDTLDRWDMCPMACCFCCLLPFGTFVAFCMYAAESSDWFSDVLDKLDLSTSEQFSVNSSQNKMKQWIRKKLNKHLGFGMFAVPYTHLLFASRYRHMYLVLEAAIEAFPQSMLQLIAIVMYQEANFVAIISILLSMTSVMTKSLILSQGLERYTFVWTWLCMVTDFFGIFFTLSFVFYSNDVIHGEYLGYFNIFGQIWLWKFACSAILLIGIGLIYFWLFGYWMMGHLFWCDTTHNGNACERCGECCLWFVFSPIMCLIAVFVTGLGCEVLCFSILAFGVYKFSTRRVYDQGADTFEWILNFIQNGKDTRIRILTINHALTTSGAVHSSDRDVDLQKYIADKVSEGGYDGLQSITYQQIRENCKAPENAAFFKREWKRFMHNFTNARDDVIRRFRENGDCAYKFFDTTYFVTFCIVAFVFAPLWVLSKVVQVLFPWIIVGYLLYHNVLFSGHVHTFQMVMLCIYIGMQLILLVLGIYVLRVHYWLLHIEPAHANLMWSSRDRSEALKVHAHEFYVDVCWYPQVTPIVFGRFGSDIGNVIMDYCKGIQAQSDRIP